MDNYAPGSDPSIAPWNQPSYHFEADSMGLCCQCGCHDDLNECDLCELCDQEEHEHS
jgi:hypothetical protein